MRFRKYKSVMYIGVAALLIIGICGLLAVRQARSFFYPVAPPMPAVTSTDLGGVLAKLEQTLNEKAPKVSAALKPGLSAGEITAFEKRAGVTLSDEMRAFYRWHDGMDAKQKYDLIPGQHFLPLEDVVAQHLAQKQQVAECTFVQHAAFEVFAGHRKSWLTLFDDGGGDGYYFDPDRTPAMGAIFFNFAEIREYRFFPSLTNLIAGIQECLDTGAFKTKDDGTLDADFEKAAKVWEKYSSSPSR